MAPFDWTIGYDGLMHFPAEYDSFLSGRGTSTLVVRGHRVAFDARQTAPACQGTGESSTFQIYLFGLDNVSKSQVSELTLVPGPYYYYDYHNHTPGIPGTIFPWSVANDGRFTFDPALSPCVSGAGTSTMRILCDPNAAPPRNQVTTCPQAVEVAVTVTNGAGAPLAGRDVRAFQGVHPFGTAAQYGLGGACSRDGAARQLPLRRLRWCDHVLQRHDRPLCGHHRGGCRSASIILPGGAPSVRVSPETVAPGSLVDVAWSGIVSPAVGDTVGLYAVGAPGISFPDQAGHRCDRRGFGANDDTGRDGGGELRSAGTEGQRGCAGDQQRVAGQRQPLRGGSGRGAVFGWECVHDGGHLPGGSMSGQRGRAA